MKRNIVDFKTDHINLMIDYFLQADDTFLQQMGVDVSKLPSRDVWYQLTLKDLARPLKQKQAYYVIWEVDNQPVGHSNINKIAYGEEAYMHLHLWQPEMRMKGQGTYFVQESISRYFETFQLQHLFCEPYALNPAPNKTLANVGFTLVKTYETTPGWLNFHQQVNRWVLRRDRWLQRFTTQ